MVLSVYIRLIYVGLLLCVVCLMQAEDVIRDLVRSRGLGDVYKRQIYLQKPLLPPLHKVSIVPRGQALGTTTVLPREDQNIHAVSYTHLTLQTSDLV